MNDDYISEIKKIMSERKQIDYDLLLSYIHNEVINRDLICYVSSIIFSDKSECMYCAGDSSITINPDEIFYESADNEIDHMITKEERITRKINDYNNQNIYNFYTINHELTHAEQIKFLLNYDHLDNNELNILRYALLTKDIILLDYINEFLQKDEYNYYHDYFFSEYDANINSYIKTLEFINSLNIDKLRNNIENFNKLISRNLIYLYKSIKNKSRFSTPFKNFNWLYNKFDKKLDIDPSIYKEIKMNALNPSSQIDKLMLGLPINNDVSEYLRLVSNEKIKTLNLFNDIKDI